MKDHSFSASGWDSQFNSEIALARAALARLSPARADDRDSWIKVAMALHDTSTDLLPDWIEFSQQSDKFKPGECEKLWRSFKPDKARTLGLGSLVRWAREDSGDPSFGKPPSEPRRFVSIDDAVEFIERRTGGTKAGLWQYDEMDRRPSFWVTRIDLPGLDQHSKREKTFRPIRMVGSHFEIGDPAGLLPLYRLSDLPIAGTIDVFEGEKAADVAGGLGLEPTTPAHGANSARRTDWKPLSGRRVRIFPDNDPNGLKYAADVGAILTSLTPPASVSVVTLPDLPPGGDIADFVEQRRAAGKTDAEIRSEIAALPEQTLASSAGPDLGASSVFQDPVPLPPEVPEVQPFDFDLLPFRLAPWVRDIAERMQCAADYIFAVVMVALAAVIGRKVGIRPKRYDNWLVVVNLWGGAIGRPGFLKTPSMQEGLKPLFQLELEAKASFESDTKAHEAASILREARRKVREQDLRKAVAEGGGDDIAREIAADKADEPTRHRYVLNDSTVEKLGEILNENPNGVLVYRDELVGLLRSLDKEGQEGARGFYLQAWNGDGSYTYDRIGRGTIEIEAAIVSIFGSIQPGPLAKYLVAGAATGQGDDGLLQRFQILVWPNQPKAWVNHDRVPDRAAREEAFAVFKALDDLTAETVGDERDPVDLEAIPFLRFSDEAQVEFDSWRAGLELRLRAGEEDETFESALAKYRSLVPSLALISHLVDVGRGPVGLPSLRRAIATAAYLESHARRIYSASISAEISAAHALSKKILSGKVASPFVLRDVYQHGWSKLKNADDVGKAVAILVEHNWIVQKPEKREMGAPKSVCYINPRIWELSRNGPGRTGRSQPDGTPKTGGGPSGTTGRTNTSPPADPEDGERPPEGTGTTGRSRQGDERGIGDDLTNGTGRTGTSGPEGDLPVLPAPSPGLVAIPSPLISIVDQVMRHFDGQVQADAVAPEPPPPAPPRSAARLTTPDLGFDAPEVSYD